MSAGPGFAEARPAHAGVPTSLCRSPAAAFLAFSLGRLPTIALALVIPVALGLGGRYRRLPWACGLVCAYVGGSDIALACLDPLI